MVSQRCVKALGAMEAAHPCTQMTNTLPAAILVAVAAALWLGNPLLLAAGVVAIALMAVWPKKGRRG